MKILEEKNNSLLHRKELVITIESNATPSKPEIKKQISEELKKPEENIIINKIGSKFGSKSFTIDVLVYEDSENKKKYTTISRKERKKLAEEAKKAEVDEKKVAEEEKAKVDEKKEEVKEQPKLEEKKEENSVNTATNEKVEANGNVSNNSETEKSEADSESNKEEIKSEDAQVSKAE